MSGEIGSWSTVQLVEFFVLKILVAILCGAIIGMERELRNKSAGLKTNILICVGASLITATSVLISEVHAARGYFGDPARLSAQIVNGIGFLGGGAIIQARGTIVGLTTAATIWVVAAIGICVGVGHADIAIMASVLTVAVLLGTTYFENKILGRSQVFTIEVWVDDPDGHARAAIHQALSRNDLSLEDFKVSHPGELTQLMLKCSGYPSNHKRFMMELWSLPRLKEIKTT